MGAGALAVAGPKAGAGAEAEAGARAGTALALVLRPPDESPNIFAFASIKRLATSMPLALPTIVTPRSAERVALASRSIWIIVPLCFWMSLIV